jgi:hypothetical protein
MAQWLTSHLLDWARAVIPGPLLDFFGIGSPSKLMRDEIGKPIGEGIAWGMKATTGLLKNQALALSVAATPPVPTVGFDTTMGLATNAGPVAQPVPQFKFYLGDRELTDLVRVEIDGRNEDMARAMLNGRRV